MACVVLFALFAPRFRWVYDPLVAQDELGQSVASVKVMRVTGSNSVVVEVLRFIFTEPAKTVRSGDHIRWMEF